MSIVPDSVQSRPITCESIEVADGHRVYLCCGKLDDEQHRNFCEHFSPRAEPDPDWCVLDHTKDDERDHLVLHMAADHTDRYVRRLLKVHNGSELKIAVARTDCRSEGREGVPTLTIQADLELTTWEQAAELARAILDGFGYLYDPNAVDSTSTSSRALAC